MRPIRMLALGMSVLSSQGGTEGQARVDYVERDKDLLVMFLSSSGQRSDGFGCVLD